MQLDSNYIHFNPILRRIYLDAVNKYMERASDEICFSYVCEYVYKKLVQRKQCVYENSLPIVKEVCQAIGEDYYAGVEYNAPEATNYRDIYFAIYE